MSGDHEQLFREFLAARPDMAKHISFDPELGPLVANDAVTQFALWAVENDYAPAGAFGKAVELQGKVNEWAERQGAEGDIVELPREGK